jgi:hypothetical protein
MGTIVDAGVDDLAVARASAGAEGGGRIENQDLSASESKLSGHC